MTAIVPDLGIAIVREGQDSMDVAVGIGIGLKAAKLSPEWAMGALRQMENMLNGDLAVNGRASSASVDSLILDFIAANPVEVVT